MYQIPLKEIMKPKTTCPKCNGNGWFYCDENSNSITQKEYYHNPFGCGKKICWTCAGDGYTIEEFKTAI